MERYLKISVWTLILLTLFHGIFAEEIVEVEDKINANAVIFVTPEAEDDVPSPTTITPAPERQDNTVKDLPKKKVKAKYEVSKRHDKGPVTFLSSKTIKEDLDNQPSRNREPARSPPLPVLSSTEDFTLNSPEVDDKSGPVAYETIVYDPDTKDASAAFSRSQIWDTPELVIKDSVQRQVGKNLLLESASHVEYTPRRDNSPQTPLNQIRYRGQQQQPSRYTGTTLQPFSRETRQPSPPRPTRPVYENNRLEEGEEIEEESRHHHRNDDEENEELNEDEEREDEPEGKYPVRLQEESFNPFAAVGEPEDIYSDVLSNIGSVFSDDGIPTIEGSVFPEGGKETSADGYKELLPQFERHSYENLQEEDRADGDGDSNEDLEEDNEELNEQEEDEGLETKQVQKAKAVPLPAVSPHATQRPYQPRRPNEEERLEKSPFPNVKIVKHGKEGNQQIDPKAPLPFSPWLPIQGPANPQPTHSWQRQQNSWVRPQPTPQNTWQQTQQTQQKQQQSWPQQQSQQKKILRSQPQQTQQKPNLWPVSNHKKHHTKKPSLHSKQQKSGTQINSAPYKKTTPPKQGYSSSPKLENEQTWHQSDQKSKHIKSEPDENDPSKPYHEAFSTSYQKKWQSSSPKKKEQNSYSKTWQENKPVTKYQSSLSNTETDASEKREITTYPTPQYSPKPKKSGKVPRQSPPVVEETDLDVAINNTTENLAKSADGNFVPPVPKGPGDIATTSSERQTNQAAVHDIDDLYAKQSDSV